MKNTTVFTSSLPEALLQKLDFYARKFQIPNNQIIEKALEDYLDKIKKAEYIHSFQQAGLDPDINAMAEEGLADYLKVIEE